MSNGEIPVIMIEATNLPQAWEKACLAVWDRGGVALTQYDTTEEVPSLDSTGIIKITHPQSEPSIHKNIPMGYKDLSMYTIEMWTSFHDYYVDDGKYTYMYSHRFRRHFGVDQLYTAIDQMIEAPHGRRNQVITWDPVIDLGSAEPPCLQRIWFRLLYNEDGKLVLNMNTHWRSRDLWKAWFANAFAMVTLQKYVVEELNVHGGLDVIPGRYVDISDSLHIYGRDQDFMEIEKMRTTSYLNRAMSSADSVVREEFELAKAEYDQEMASSNRVTRGLQKDINRKPG